MNILIQELNEENVRDVNQCDGIFTIDSRLVIYTENGELYYTIVSLTPFKKRYDLDDIDYTTYINNPDKTIFFAYVDNIIAGQIILRKNWNQFAHIEDIVVDAKFRKLGIGRILIEHAIEWAKKKNLPGIMLETQDNNVAACMFYEHCGFKLKGFDKYLYRSSKHNKYEIALFWYLVFGEE